MRKPRTASSASAAVQRWIIAPSRQHRISRTRPRFLIGLVEESARSRLSVGPGRIRVETFKFSRDPEFDSKMAGAAPVGWRV